APLLLVGAVRDDRRARHPEPDDADVRRRLGRRHLLVEDRLEAVRRAGASELLRPRQAGVARLEELAAPLAHEGIVEPLCAAAAARAASRCCTSATRRRRWNGSSVTVPMMIAAPSHCDQRRCWLYA